MASGIHASANRPKTSLKGGSSKKKRFRNTTEAQTAYHQKIAARRAKKLKKR